VAIYKRLPPETAMRRAVRVVLAISQRSTELVKNPSGMARANAHMKSVCILGEKSDSRKRRARENETGI
jgi:hypothetical protein